MTNRLLALLAVALLAAGCGTATTFRGTTTAGNDGDDPGAVPDFPSPPPVRIAWDGGSASLDPWTFCFANGCADGAPPEHPEDVGSPGEVRVSYPLEGWTFSVEFQEAGKRCGRRQYAPLEPGPDGTTVVHPLGYAGSYDVHLYGAHPGEGDVATTFHWTTTEDGPLPDPHGSLAVLAEHDGVLDSYGVELSLGDLATTPRAAAAEVTVTAADGSSVTLEPHRQRGCTTEGSLFFSAPDSVGRRAAELHGTSFDYRVALRLDGKRYDGSATWPDDLLPDNEPSVDLDFTPALPALTPRT